MLSTVSKRSEVEVSAATRPPKSLLYALIPDTTPFWVFAYGSLIWRPGFDYQQQETVELQGYRRSLCIRSWHHRGTPEFPGLVFGLKSGGCCQGKAFLVSPDARISVLDYLYDRELLSHCYHPMRLPMIKADGEQAHALTFVANPEDPQYVDDMPIATAAGIINQAKGSSGANREYVLNTWQHLHDLSMQDEWLDRLVNQL